MRQPIILFIITLLTLNIANAQVYSDQNGIKTYVTNPLGANATIPIRYQIATVGYNSHHWQPSGFMTIELFCTSYGTGYEKYVLEIGYGQGTQGSSPCLTLVESMGIYHNAKIALGEPYELSSLYGDKPNVALPIFLDVRFYSTYIAKITFQQNKVSEVTDVFQIKMDEHPSSIPISDFTVPTTTTIKSNILFTGNIGIGITPSSHKLDVNGTIRAKEVKVESGWADFVFAPNYQLRSLAEVEEFIDQNGHLPDIPTAKEVEQNGVSLGEINAKLLQKVEELTLYLIEKEKEIKELKKNSKKYNELIERINKLENNINRTNP